MTKRMTLGGIAVALFIALAAFGLARSTAEATFEVLVDASPDTDTNLVGEDHTVSAVVTDNGTPTADWEVTFDVITGPNTGEAGADVSDANGEVSFTYAGDGGVGTDQIRVCVTVFVGGEGVSGAGGNGQLNCEVVEKTWVEPTPTPTPEPEPSATPTATPAQVGGAGELPDTGSLPPAGGGFPWLGAILLTLAGSALAAGGWAVSRRNG